MTLLHELKPMEACGGSNAVSAVVGMNCCSSAASSEISIDEASSSSNCSKVNNNLVYHKDKYDYIKADFPRCKQIDIEFENIKYTVRKFSFPDRKFVTKEILHGVNGTFRSGELSAIMGPSGSGKSTLLNVLSGFRATGVSGSIKVNGNHMSTTSSQHYRELSCYIHQDDLLRAQLTVGETMMLAAHLKLGFKVTREHKTNLIKHILELLGLDHRFNVYNSKLSGGQKKRLAISLELISNPPVLFLDEPTTGLDSSSCSQCVALLKRLAAQGHTIICTIHQPSALIFEMFDKLYTVAEGNCIYQGPIRELIPFLNDQGLVCPSYHNPADFLMEVAVGEHERDLEKLINAANKKYYEDIDIYQLSRVTRLISKIQENIEVNQSCNKAVSGGELPSYGGTSFAQFPSFHEYAKPVADDLALEETKALNKVTAANMKNQQNQQQQQQQQPQQQQQQQQQTLVRADEVNTSIEIVTCMAQASFLMQYLLLFQRIVVCARRNYFLLMARVMSHVVIGVIFGYLYRNVGDKATTVLGNYVYLYGTILLLVYTGKMAVVLTFPLEIGMLSREHFNRWYGLGPYFLSLLTFEIPFQSACAVLYMLISIYMTGNDNDETFRIYYFLLLGILATLSAQAWGFFVGATLPTKLAVFLGPILAVLFSVFGFCTRYIDITPIFRWMWHISYFRAGFHGVLNAVYGMDRKSLPCPDNTMYCHFRSPKVFLSYMMISDVSLTDSVTLMGAVIAIMHVLTLVTLWYKLNKR